MTNPTELFLSMLAGLGLFFVGVKMVGRNLNSLVSEQLRLRIKRASENLWMSGVFGTLIGFVTQSGRTTSFIMAGFVQGGMIDVRHALLIMLWSNLGCTLIISAAVVPIHLFALFLLGAAGACIAFERPRPLVNAANAIFGLALMLFGLRMMSGSASVLTELPWFSGALEVVNTSLIYGFLMGLLLTFIAQSHMSIILIVVTLAGNGILNFNQTLMMIYGAHAGSSLITYVTGAHFVGQPRQIVVGQILYNLAGILLFMVLFLIDNLFAAHTLHLQQLASTFSSSTGVQAATIAVTFNAVTPFLLTTLLAPFHRLCARLSPPSLNEELSKPKYLHAELADTPVAMLMLAEKEQARLLRRLPDYFELARNPTENNVGGSLTIMHTAFGTVSAQIQRFQNLLMSRNLSPDDTEWLLNQQRRQELLNATEEVCHELCDAVLAGIDSEARDLGNSIMEALDTMLLTAISGIENSDLDELKMLETMTRDRGGVMENVRKSYLVSSDLLAPATRSQILHITSMFERMAWSIRRFGELLKTSPIVQSHIA